MKANEDIIKSYDRNYDFSDNAVFPLELAWKSKISTSNRPVSMPLIENDTLYLLSNIEKGKGVFSSAMIYSFNTKSGDKNWDYKIDKRSGWMSQNCLINGMFVTSTKQGLIGVKDGELIFKSPIGERSTSIVEQENSYLVSRPDGIYIVDPSGKIIETIRAKRPSIVTVSKGRIIFGSKNSLYCYELSDYRLLWETNLSEIGKYHDKTQSRIQKKDIYVNGRLRSRYALISNGRVYCCIGCNMICLNLENGKVIWKGVAMGDPVHSKDKVVSYCETGDLFCLNASDGSTIYKKKPTMIRGLTVSLPFVSGNTFFVCANKIMAFDINKGELVWEFQGKRAGTYFFDPIYINGSLYTGCSDGYIYSFKTKDE